MTQSARDVGEFGLWVDHFEQNVSVHIHVDAAIDFDGQCQISEAVRRPLIESVRRFQLGESGDGLQLLRKVAEAGDPEYLRAAELFVAEEQQHAAQLLRLLGYLGGEPMRRHGLAGDGPDPIARRVRRSRIPLRALRPRRARRLREGGGRRSPATDHSSGGQCQHLMTVSESVH